MKLSEIILAVQEGIKATDPGQSFVLEHELDQILWKINSGRMKDLDIGHTLRIKELINLKSKNDEN